MANQVTTLKMGQKFKKTPAGEIPVDWDSVLLGDSRLVEVLKSGGTPNTQTAAYWDNGDIPFVKIEDITKSRKYLRGTTTRITEEGLKNSSAWLVPPKALLLSMYGSYGEVAINELPVATNQAIIAIRLRESVANLEFFYYSLISLKTRWHRQTQETTQKNLSAGIIRRLPLPLPPIDEQMRIVEILASVDDAIDKTDAVIEKQRTLKDGLAQQLFTRGAGGHKRFKATSIGRFPEAWDLQPCEEICDMVTVGIVIQPARLYTETGIPCLRSLNIHEDSISADNLVFISPVANEAHAKSKLRVGDVVAVRTGYPGTACVIPEKYDGANCVDLIILRPNKSIFGHFLSRFINSPEGRKQIERTQGGLAQQHFNVGEAAKMLVPVPAPHEQQQIVSILQSVENQIKSEESHRDRFIELKRGLMHTLLTGRVRVS